MNALDISIILTLVLGKIPNSSIRNNSSDNFAEAPLGIPSNI